MRKATVQSDNGALVAPITFRRGVRLRAPAASIRGQVPAVRTCSRHYSQSRISHPHRHARRYASSLRPKHNTPAARSCFMLQLARLDTVSPAACRHRVTHRASAALADALPLTAALLTPEPRAPARRPTCHASRGLDLAAVYDFVLLRRHLTPPSVSRRHHAHPRHQVDLCRPAGVVQ